MPMTIAGMVPQPTWAFHHPKIGAVSEVQVRHDERRDDQDHADGDRHRLPATDPHARKPIARGAAITGTNLTIR